MWGGGRWDLGWVEEPVWAGGSPGWVDEPVWADVRPGLAG